MNKNLTLEEIKALCDATTFIHAPTGKRWRISDKVKEWKRTPGKFRLPLKHGLYRSDQPEQSYSERQIYQAALERLARELAAVEKIDQLKAAEKIEAVMTKERLKKAA